MGHSNTNCASLSTALKEQTWHSPISLETGIIVHHPISMASPCMVRGVVRNNDLAVWWSQWLLQVQFTFIFKKFLEVKVNSFFLDNWKEFHYLVRNLRDINMC